jgi:hypothetical protein
VFNSLPPKFAVWVGIGWEFTSWTLIFESDFLSICEPFLFLESDKSIYDGVFPAGSYVDELFLFFSASF